MIRCRSRLPQGYWRTPLTDTFAHFTLEQWRWKWVITERTLQKRKVGERRNPGLRGTPSVIHEKCLKVYFTFIYSFVFFFKSFDTITLSRYIPSFFQPLIGLLFTLYINVCLSLFDSKLVLNWIPLYWYFTVCNNKVEYDLIWPSK